MVTSVKEIVMHASDGITVSAFHGKIFLVNRTAAILNLHIFKPFKSAVCI